MTAYTTNSFDPRAYVALDESGDNLCLLIPGEEIDAWCIARASLAPDRSFLRLWCYRLGGEEEYPFDLGQEDHRYGDILERYPWNMAWLPASARKGVIED